MSRAFITGVDGQDGSYLAERLLGEGVEVHALVLAGAPGPHRPAGMECHIGDIGDIEATRALVRDLSPDEIYNLAAISSVAQSWQQPDLTSTVNGSAAVALMESARLAGDHVRFVQPSSAEIFGQPSQAPQNEQTPLRPVNPYGAAKAYAHLGAGVFRARGLHVSSAILYNHESPRRPTTFVTRKITSTVAAIARGHADSLTLGNLEARRDWGWAPDYVDALVRAARADEPADHVIATGVSHSVRDFVAAAFTAVGIEDWASLVGTDPAFVRPVDPGELVGDASRARMQLGWAPTVGFEDLVARMVAAELH